MNNRLVAYLQLHLAVVLYGLTAILGKLISISAINLVWWRVLITSFSLLFFIQFGKKLLRLSRRLIIIYLLIGFLVGLHWITFYGAIKYANASIALAAMATTSFFTSLLEPAITRKKWKSLEVILGVLVIPPMLLIAQNIELEMKIGLWVGLLSAFLASLFATLNKKYIEDADPYQISFLEMFGAFLLISIILPFVQSTAGPLQPNPSDWIYLLILALLCTTLAYVISMKALKVVTAFDANLVINLEPVYGIVLAIFILKEHQQLSPQFYLGVLLIMLIVFLHPLIDKKLYGKS